MHSRLGRWFRCQHEIESPSIFKPHYHPAHLHLHTKFLVCLILILPRRGRIRRTVASITLSIVLTWSACIRKSTFTCCCRLISWWWHGGWDSGLWGRLWPKCPLCAHQHTCKWIPRIEHSKFKLRDESATSNEGAPFRLTMEIFIECIPAPAKWQYSSKSCKSADCGVCCKAANNRPSDWASSYS